MSTYGTYIITAGLLIFAYNFLVAGRRGPAAGNDPWNAPTLEWSIPSPPPEYNFAQMPEIHSRYPMWDQRASDVDHPKVNLTEGKSPEQMGIIMPYNTIKPLFVALGMVIMFVGLIASRDPATGGSKPVLWVIFAGAAVMVGALYSWLLSPLEPEHHAH